MEFYCNIETRDTESYYNQQCDPDKNWGKGSGTDNLNCPKYLESRITDGLLYGNGIYCNEINVCMLRPFCAMQCEK